MKWIFKSFNKYSKVSFICTISLAFCACNEERHFITAKRIWTEVPIRNSFVIDNGEGKCYDFGRVSYGSIKLKAKTTKNDTIFILFSELAPTDKKQISCNELSQYLIISPNRKEYIVKFNNVEKPYSKQSIQLPPEYSSTVTPFRYCSIRKKDAEILEVTKLSLELESDYDLSFFTSSDSTLNAVYDMCKNTMRATSVFGAFIDGSREKVPYEADTYIAQRSHFNINKDYEISRNTLDYLIKHPTWPSEWILQTVPLFYDYYLYTGDLTFIRKNYPSLKARSLYLLQNKEGLISTYSKRHNLGYLKYIGYDILLRNQLKVVLEHNPPKLLHSVVDWPMNQTDNFEFEEFNSVTNAYFYNSLKLLSVLAKELAYTEDAEHFLFLAKKCKKSYNKVFYDEGLGLYKDGKYTDHISLHANIFALAFNLVPEHRKGKVIEFIKSKGMSCSPYAAQFLIDGLFDNNEYDYAYSLLVSHEKNSWYNMINKGYTTTLESWDFNIKPNADLTHVWSTAPLNIIHRQLWGVQPLTPGFKKVLIHPKLSGLVNSSQIVIPTTLGSIKGNYTNTNGIEAYEFTIPKKMTFNLIYDPNIKVIINQQ